MVAKRDDWMSVEDFLALDRESFDQKYENVELESIGLSVPVKEIYDRIILPPFDPFREYRKPKVV
jgi:hypothetical protein